MKKASEATLSPPEQMQAAGVISPFIKRLSPRQVTDILTATGDLKVVVNNEITHLHVCVY